MTLEQQIETLAELGLHLNEGVTIDDLLLSFSREQYEEHPFHLILFCYGGVVAREPWSQRICSQVLNFDLASFKGKNDYVNIVQELCKIADETERLTDILDFVDFGSNNAWLEYTVNAQRRHINAELNGDWIDTRVLYQIMGDIENKSQQFYMIEVTAGILLFYLEASKAKTLHQRISHDLRPVTSRS